MRQVIPEFSTFSDIKVVENEHNHLHYYKTIKVPSVCQR